MPIYTLKTKATAYTEQSNGAIEEILDFDIELLRDGVVVGIIKQRFGSETTDQVIREKLESLLKNMAREDHLTLTHTTLKDRCKALESNMDTWELGL